jgi:hypothetical protein
LSRRRKLVATLLAIVALFWLWNSSECTLHAFGGNYGCDSNMTLSTRLLVSTDSMARRRRKICHHTRGESRRWCDGVERCTRMGNRA